MKNEERESVQPGLKANPEQEQLKPHRDIAQLEIVHPGVSKDMVSDVNTGMSVSAEMNMEAPITSDDVMRAGGFGARDDIGCFLPVASDSTDFEASVRDARDYEDPQENIGKPGLGWKGVGMRE